MDEDFTVTPWEVKGDVDYDKLVKKFGTSYIDQDLLDKIQKHTDYLHTMLRRKIFFSHRDLNLLIDNYNHDWHAGCLAHIICVNACRMLPPANYVLLSFDLPFGHIW